MNGTLRFAYALILLVLSIIGFVGVGMICGVVYGLGECVGLINQAIFGLVEDEGE